MVKSTVQGVRDGRVKEKERKYAAGGTSSRHAQENFGRGSAGQTWKVRGRREVLDKEMQEGKKVHGREG